MSRPLSSDLIGVLKGLSLVLSNAAKLQEAQCQQVWQNSSIKTATEELNGVLSARLKEAVSQASPNQIQNLMTEAIQRSAMVAEGIKGVLIYSNKPIGDQANGVDISELELEFDKETMFEDVENLFRKGDKEVPTSSGEVKVISITSEGRFGSKKPSENNTTTELINASNNLVEAAKTQLELLKGQEKPQDSFSIKKVNDAHVDLPSEADAMESVEKDRIRNTSNEPKFSTMPQPEVVSAIPTPTAKKAPKKKPSLSETAKQRKVPSSRIGRMMSFGSLAAGLGVGTIAEVTRRSLGLADSPSVGTTLDSAFLSPANAERIVDTLCKVRGAALKIGQILSIQDNNIISPQLQKAFERVRQSADFMPSWQVEKVLSQEFGPDWRSKLNSFEMKPFAAASIGQVHSAVLQDGTEVAMKIQYPGVAQGINSDIDNLVGIMKVWNIFPKGMFIDNVVDVAKRELSWEVDYKREVECTKKFQDLLKDYPDYYIPRVIDEFCTSQVFTSELIEGVPVDKCVDMDEETRKHICFLVMQLCLREMFQFRYMQTDPNWSNFFYNPETRQLVLLDFGASREYSKEFMDQYIQVIKAAADNDKDRVLRLSKEMGFLTGYESKTMEEAHVNAVMILAEVFLVESGEFDFGAQDTTKRIQHLVPTIISQRLCPPPEEIYSLHRKLSGVFLLCAKLRVKMNCRDIFLDVYNKYRFS